MIIIIVTKHEKYMINIYKCYQSNKDRIMSISMIEYSYTKIKYSIVLHYQHSYVAELEL